MHLGKNLPLSNPLSKQSTFSSLDSNLTQSTGRASPFLSHLILHKAVYWKVLKLTIFPYNSFFFPSLLFRLEHSEGKRLGCPWLHLRVRGSILLRWLLESLLIHFYLVYNSTSLSKIPEQRLYPPLSVSLPSATFSNVIWLPGNWPWWAYLHHRTWQTPQLTTSPPQSSWLNSDLPLRRSLQTLPY